MRLFPIGLLYVLTAIGGGCARYLNDYINGKGFKIRAFIASAFVAGFSGYMFALLGISLNLPLPMLSMMSGVGGYFGEQTMTFIMEYLSKRLR